MKMIFKGYKKSQVSGKDRKGNAQGNFKKEN